MRYSHGSSLSRRRVVADQLALAARLVLDRLGDDCPVDAGQLGGPLDDAGPRDSRQWPSPLSFLQDVAHGGPGPQRRGAVDAEPLGQLVGRLEADAPDVGGQAIGVVPHELDGLVAVGLVDADGPRRADAVRLQEDHDARGRPSARCQLSRMRWMRRGPMPLTSCRNAGLSSMTSRVRSPKTSTILRA